MKALYKLILLFFTIFMIVPKGYSQNNADPGIGILMSPAIVAQGSVGILSATVGNYGNGTIVSNSLRVTISVGSNAEILGIASGSDARWTQLSLTTGSGNTIKLTNTGGEFSSFDASGILLIVRGNVVSGATGIAGNIVYITGPNPLLCASCSSPPQSLSQGNASNSNDNSETSLAVTCVTTAEPVHANCWDTYTFNTATCAWENNNTPQPAEPVHANCWDTYTFNTATCAWENNNTPQSPQPISLGTSSNPTTCSGIDGSLQITGLTASTSYTVNYLDGGNPVGVTLSTNSSGEITITALDAGSYQNISVTIFGCTSNTLAGPIILTDPGAPVIALGTTSNPTSAAGVDGSIQITGLTASTSYTVNYLDGGVSVGTTLSSNSSGAITISGLNAGTYTNIGVTISGCTSNILAAPISLTALVILPNFSVTIDINSLVFLAAGDSKDFVVNTSEINGGSSNGQVIVKIKKQSAFLITYGAATSTSSVNGGVSVNNTDWIITENGSFVTMTLKTTAIIGANLLSAVGFTITRKPAVPAQTSQPITVTIVNGSGSDIFNFDNTYNTVVTAQ